jgi:hypothetical protein
MWQRECMPVTTTAVKRFMFTAIASSIKPDCDLHLPASSSTPVASTQTNNYYWGKTCLSIGSIYPYGLAVP